MPLPTSTYRLQLRGDAFTLADASDVVDYLHDLGVTHLYLSPILTATDGSTHGYDVTDTSTVSAALGGREALTQLHSRAAEVGMGIIVDIVPNHVGVEDPRQNAWWWDVLRRGRDSEYATYFDIDFGADNGVDGKIAIPVLGSASDVGELTVDRSEDQPLLAFYEHRFPIADGTDSGDAQAVHDRQSYRLVSWSDGLIGYRRFFSVNGLAGIRQEDLDVFTDSHRQVASWIEDGLIDGLRVDHPDGLADPAGYLTELRGLLGPDRWLVIEKILADGEPLDESLPVDGTTGYDALSAVGGVFVDPEGVHALTALSQVRSGIAYDSETLHETELDLKTGVARGDLSPEVRRLARAVVRESGTTVDLESVIDAIVAVVAAVPVYRTDYAPLARVLPGVIAEIGEEQPELAAGLGALTTALIGGAESPVRFDQVCGAVTAKGVEDCLFYRANRLISLQEVGGDPSRFGCSTEFFHLTNADRAKRWPAAMTTLSTHDTKRGEDVRARIGVLSQTPELWARCITDWEELAPSPDGTTGMFLWQNLFGVWPTDGVVTSSLRERVHAYAEKAIREAALRTTWTDPDEEFESAVHSWLDAIFDGAVARSMSMLVEKLAPHGHSDALGQKLLNLAGPGIPDVYQGTELWEDSLVDPDNRRPVDYSVRRSMLAASNTAALSIDTGAAKLAVVRAALHVRRERPKSFVGGTYTPIVADGSAAEHLVGFSRGPVPGNADVIALATRLSLGLSEQGWGETSVALPDGRWRDRITDVEHTGTVSVAEVFASLPVALLVRDNEEAVTQ
ncbi:malto-oligosyltrehalose synthase [Rhodococcus sp. 05-2255-3B1]|uniref:malto-oligosyltrehalose synthase n=1 Tax=unclassified Rhodococcus (in: high G+C Gram-positive bacteria) TaxID=192944 RepID=UPI000B9B852E|nr:MULTISPECIES: malto-oligosyltrehalose synthase [unclassified Rhodococcus (in: high G+C Gram-positive bacteria)]OZE04145.1 malto-oligosyltrehalose synthase [Rhodococcus sp. 05-2255-3C]OZE10737.1 malto-oligosyltrehalose synthase [Rhodococcus sp. 05-2255-3B1]OZE20813.1 malto-oligosyltrehalose synthase [Rhodococcus sp. 05-2255-2A2]